MYSFFSRAARGLLILLLLSLLLLGPASTVTASRAEWPGNYSSSDNGHPPTSSIVSANKSAAYWLANIKHQGFAPFAGSDYAVFRNVKDYGAKGDGVTDDTAAINLAISSGNRCGQQACHSSTITPAIVYFPGGTYLLSASIIDFYYTQLIGDPNDMPLLKAMPDFEGLGIIDGDQYGAAGLAFQGVNVFFRQVRNFILDLTAVPPSVLATGIHWPTAQATSIQNCVFLMSEAEETKHRGIFIEEGSGGFMTDLVFHGGGMAVFFGNQQFTMRNLTFYNAVTAIHQLWDWGWTYKSINIINCSVGLNMSEGGQTSQTVNSVTLIDSSITDTSVGIITSHDATSQSASGSLIIENVKLKNVPIAIQGPESSTVLGGSTGSLTIASWGQGHAYTPTGPTNIEGPIAPFPRPGSLLADEKFYERSKPQYADVPVSNFLSVRDLGAKGDGATDDSETLNAILAAASLARKIVFFDAGIYLVKSTVEVPPGSRIVGESYPLIMGAGTFFSDIDNPQPVVRIGKKGGESGDAVEWSDMIVATKGATAGAVLIEWNLDTCDSTPSGMWDVHTRIGGFRGSDLQATQCPTTPSQNVTNLSTINTNCIAAFMSMHVTKSAAGLYLENVWLWTADHDMDDPKLTQLTIYAGRGLYIESAKGEIWLVGTAVEHHTLYQYQLHNTESIFMGQIQTETAYYQPNPPATLPFPVVKTLHDPDFASSCANRNGTCAAGWSLRVLDSTNVLVYGAGLYSFFSNYNTTCSAVGSGATCQTRIFGIDMGGSVPAHNISKHDSSSIYVYNLNVVGATSMVDRQDMSLARFGDNIGNFPSCVALFRA